MDRRTTGQEQAHQLARIAELLTELTRTIGYLAQDSARIVAALDRGDFRG